MLFRKKRVSNEPEKGSELFLVRQGELFKAKKVTFETHLKRQDELKLTNYLQAVVNSSDVAAMRITWDGDKLYLSAENCQKVLAIVQSKRSYTTITKLLSNFLFFVSRRIEVPWHLIERELQADEPNFFIPPVRDAHKFLYHDFKNPYSNGSSDVSPSHNLATLWKVYELLKASAEPDDELAEGDLSAGDLRMLLNFEVFNDAGHEVNYGFLPESMLDEECAAAFVRSFCSFDLWKDMPELAELQVQRIREGLVPVEIKRDELLGLYGAVISAVPRNFNYALSESEAKFLYRLMANGNYGHIAPMGNEIPSYASFLYLMLKMSEEDFLVTLEWSYENTLAYCEDLGSNKLDNNFFLQMLLDSKERIAWILDTSLNGELPLSLTLTIDNPFSGEQGRELLESWFERVSA